MSAPKELKPATKALMARLINVFGDPRRPDPEKFIAEVGAAVDGFPTRVLDRAGDKIIRTSTFWPQPAEAVRIASDICDELDAEDRSRHLASLDEQERRRREPSEDEKARVRALMHDLNLKIRSISEDGEKAQAAEARDREIKAQRPAFEKLMRESPNQHMYLSERSKAMMGDRE